jgi:hypothetical protein
MAELKNKYNNFTKSCRMKSSYSLLLFVVMMLNSYSSIGQIQITPISKKVGFNSASLNITDSIKLDMDADLQYDFQIGSENLPVGFNQLWYCKSINPNQSLLKYEFTTLLKVGQSIHNATFYEWPTPFCESYWDSDYWAKTISDRYIGLRKISNNDTNYGWIQLQYLASDTSSPSFVNDTLFVEKIAYNQTPNDTIKAGLTTPSSVYGQTEGTHSYHIEWNSDNITIIPFEAKTYQMAIYDLIGRKMIHQTSNAKTHLFIGNLPKGIYILGLYNELANHHAIKFFKN